MYDDSGRPRAALSVFVCVVGESLCVCVCVFIYMRKKDWDFAVVFFFFFYINILLVCSKQIHTYFTAVEDADVSKKKNIYDTMKLECKIRVHILTSGC